MTKHKEMPKWATAPFEDFLDTTENIGRVVHLSIRGISMIIEVPKAVEALSRLDVEDGKISLESAEKKRKRAEAEAEIAKRERENDFPLLHAQAVVALWSALESLFRNVLSTWLRNCPAHVLGHDRLRKLKVNIAEYEGLHGDERVEFLAELIEREADAPLRQGVSRFEELLDLMGLAGSIEDDVKRSLFEMSNARNVIVHRRGIVDRRFVESCPWLSVTSGQPLKISHAKFVEYGDAAHSYVLECIQRTRIHFGLLRYVHAAPQGKPLAS